MLTAIVAIIVFFLLVSIHEFGHFISAKLCGVTVLEFSLGMGPAIFKKEYKNTLYSLRILPLGGFCKMEGEEITSDDPHAFTNKNPWQRLVILASGAAMNLLLGYILYVIIMFNTPQIAVPKIAKLVNGYPAEISGMQIGDRITNVNGKKVNTTMDLSYQLYRNGAKNVDLTYIRDNVKSTVNLKPILDEGTYKLGYYSDIENLTTASRFKYAYHSSVFMGKIIVVSFGDLITGKVPANQISGPVGIVSEIGSATDESKKSKSIVPILTFTALITINLGVFNLLPIPALDGGRIFFILVSLIIRKPIPPEKEGMVHFIGFVLLILLVIFATSNDIFRIFKGA